MSRFGIMTMNEKELWAIQKLFTRQLGFKEIPGSSRNSRFGSSIRCYSWGEHEIVLVNNVMSGNLVAASIAFEEFSDDKKGFFNCCILFGCAGVIPVHGKEYTDNIPTGLEKGKVVVVIESNYIENGEVKLRTTKSSNEEVSIKQDRLRTHYFYPDWGWAQRFADEVGIPAVKAACSEKLIKLDMVQASLFQSSSAENYSSALMKTKADIVDMESFGFFQAFGGRSRDVVVLRVITDALSDHGLTKGARIDENGCTILTSEQEKLLEVGAYQVLEFLNFYLKEVKPPSTPIVRSEFPSTKRHEISVGTEALRSGIERILKEPEYFEGSQISELRVFCSRLILSLFKEVDRLVDDSVEYDSSEILYLISGLAVFMERGYGSLLSAGTLDVAGKLNGISVPYKFAPKASREPKYFNESKLGSSPLELFTELMHKINPKEYPKTSLESAFDFHFGLGQRLNQLRFDYDRKSSSVLISGTSSNSRTETQEIMVGIGTDLGRDTSHVKSKGRPHKIRWDGFDSDTKFIGEIGEIFQLPLLKTP